MYVLEDHNYKYLLFFYGQRKVMTKSANEEKILKRHLPLSLCNTCSPNNKCTCKHKTVDNLKYLDLVALLPTVHLLHITQFNRCLKSFAQNQI